MKIVPDRKMNNITVEEAVDLYRTFEPITVGFGIAIENGNAIGYYIGERGGDRDAQVKKAV